MLQPLEPLEPKNTRRFVLAALAAVTAATVTFGAPGVARAEDVSPNGKGIAGGALIGGELVVFTEAIIGVRSPLAYGLGAGAGAVAGGFGGWAVESAVSDGRIPAYILVGGLALLIPAIVVTLDQTRYLPTEGARDDKPVSSPPSDPGKPGGSAVIGAEPSTPTATPSTNPSSAPPTSPATPAPAPVPAGSGGGTKAPLSARSPRSPGSPQPARPAPADSLVNVRGTGLSVGVPVPEMRPMFTAAQKRALGVENAGNEVRFPLMRVTF